MSQYIQVITTTDKEEDALRIARTLVERRLAACVQVSGPLTSTYRWKGKIETSREWQCVAKTRAELFDQLSGAIREVHPYEVPEILATPVLAGHPPYLAWMDAELSGTKGEPS